MSTVYNKGFDINQYIRRLSPGLERSILRILAYRVGRENSISRDDLVNQVQGLISNEREVRLMINILRKKGFPICSTGGKSGGYWLARSPQELADYLNNEPKARVKDLMEQITAQEDTSKILWGEGTQGRLF